MNVESRSVKEYAITLTPEEADALLREVDKLAHRINEDEVPAWEDMPKLEEVEFRLREQVIKDGE